MINEHTKKEIRVLIEEEIRQKYFIHIPDTPEREAELQELLDCILSALASLDASRVEMVRELSKEPVGVIHQEGVEPTLPITDLQMKKGYKAALWIVLTNVFNVEE